ncbi:MAG: DNA polymerase beta protein [uncultured bacterium]|nr:MAG: DNA polymerase beta protein [uncultured bacterium]
MNVTEAELAIVREVFSRHLKGHPCTLYVFGSQVKGKAREDSDLDILVESENRLPLHQIAKIKEDLENSNLRYPVDIVESKALAESYREEVMRTAVELC